MSDEHDSWLKSAFDFDISGALGAVQAKAEAAATRASETLAAAADHPGDAAAAVWQGV